MVHGKCTTLAKRGTREFVQWPKTNQKTPFPVSMRQVDLFKTKEKELKNYINNISEKEWTKR